MNSILKIYTKKPKELSTFLSKYFSSNFSYNSESSWTKEYENPLDLAPIITAFIDNSLSYPNCNLWVSLDPRYIYKY